MRPARYVSQMNVLGTPRYLMSHVACIEFRDVPSARAQDLLFAHSAITRECSITDIDNVYVVSPRANIKDASTATNSILFVNRQPNLEAGMPFTGG